MSRHEAVIAQLRSHAVTAAGNSYSPYSQFPVGAAAISEDGDIYIGCNVENASYSLTQCAERTALTAAVSDGVARSSVVALLIYTPGNKAYPPCGACRQFMYEFEPKLIVITQGTKGPRAEAQLDELLPKAFRPGDLNIGGA